MRLLAVNITRLNDERVQLSAVYRALYELALSVSSIKAKIIGEDSFSNIKNDFETILHCLDDEIAGCKQLYEGIDVICQLYSTCEDRVLDFGEGVLIKYDQPNASFVDLSQTAEILKDFQF